MARGGARVNSGPLPKDDANRRRRNAATTSVVVLPREGYTGPIPTWPSGRPTKAVAAMWEQLWRKPQAAAWADLGFELLVARLAVLMVASMKPGALAATLTEVRQIEDRLGLNPAAMQRLRWKVADPEQANATSAPVVALAAERASRRPQAVDPE